MSTVEQGTDTAAESATTVPPATVADQDADRQRLTFFGMGDARDVFEAEAMSFPEFPDGILDELAAEDLDLTPLGVGNTSTMLFQGKGPDGFSLAHAWFAPNYLLPRHSHDADCLYFVFRGSIKMGSRELGEGDGFFINADGPYAYQAGPEGAEVLEFRQKTTFDMKMLDTKIDRWRVITAIGAANVENWTELRAQRDTPT